MIFAVMSSYEVIREIFPVHSLDMQKFRCTFFLLQIQLLVMQLAFHSTNTLRLGFQAVAVAAHYVVDG